MVDSQVKSSQVVFINIDKVIAIIKKRCSFYGSQCRNSSSVAGNVVMQSLMNVLRTLTAAITNASTRSEDSVVNAASATSYTPTDDSAKVGSAKCYK